LTRTARAERHRLRVQEQVQVQEQEQPDASGSCWRAQPRGAHGTAARSEIWRRPTAPAPAPAPERAVCGASDLILSRPVRLSLLLVAALALSAEARAAEKIVNVEIDGRLLEPREKFLRFLAIEPGA